MFPVTQIDCAAITDWQSFHDAFAAAFSFPDYYGRNMNAWIDCMSDLDEPGVVQLDSVKPFRKRCPDIYAAIVECSAFVNWRFIESGSQPVVFLAFHE